VDSALGRGAALDPRRGPAYLGPIMRRAFNHAVGTFLGVGHIPLVPASWTSLVVAILFVWPFPLSLTTQAIVLAVFVILGVPACTGLEKEYGKDPKQATMDEAAGMLITLMGVAPTLRNALLGFLLFRLFDVLKPPPARQLERLPVGWGIMADDLMAGVYGRIALALILGWLARGTP